MDVQTLEKLVTLGKEIGSEGKDLQDFLRDKRATFRERQFEEKKTSRKGNRKTKRRARINLGMRAKG